MSAAASANHNQPAYIGGKRGAEAHVAEHPSSYPTDWICRAVVVLVWLAVWTPRLNGPIDFRWDASTYYVLGTALGEGKGYRLLNEPGEVHAVQYPPLLPALVAAHQRVIGTTDYFKVGSALRLTYFIVSGLLLLVAYQLARQVLSPLYSLIVATITALSFNSFLELSDVLYADILFTLVTLSFLVLAGRKETFRIAAGKWLLASAGYLLRTAGIALLIAWVLESFVRRRPRQLIVRLIACALPVLLWQAYIHSVITSSEYQHPIYAYQRAPYYYPNVTYGANSSLVDPFRPELGQISGRDVLMRTLCNITLMPRSLAESVVVRCSVAPFLSRHLHFGRLRVSETGVYAILYGGLTVAGLLVLVGAILLSNQQYWLWRCYFFLVLLLVVITPWESQFWRYLAPLTPLTLTFLFRALFAIRRAVCRSAVSRPALGWLTTIGPAAAILFIQAVVAAHLFGSMGQVSYYNKDGRERVFKLIDYGPEWHALDPAFEWLRRNAPPDAVIATTVPQLAYLRTGRKAVLPPFVLDPEKATALLHEIRVKYLVVDQFGRPGISERYAAPLVQARPSDWSRVFTSPDTITAVYEQTR
jgi:hypothetical protein